MTKTLDIVTETVLVLQPGVKVTVECDKPTDVTVAHRPPKTDDYVERENTLMQFLHTSVRLAYLDKVVEMYNSLDPVGRKAVMDSLEWTKYKREYFVRDFIAAVNNEYINTKKRQKG